MHFYSFSIRKSNDFGRDKYENVCLIIDDDVTGEMCTTSKFGFIDADLLDFITWKKSVHQPISKLALIFRSDQPAIISEVDIRHIGRIQIYKSFLSSNLF